jgi:hypothetical protein
VVRLTDVFLFSPTIRPTIRILSTVVFGGSVPAGLFKSRAAVDSAVFSETISFVSASVAAKNAGGQVVSSQGSLWWIVIVAAVALIAIGAFVALVIARRKRNQVPLREAEVEVEVEE